jgi:hypothetical protein
MSIGRLALVVPQRAAGGAWRIVRAGSGLLAAAEQVPGLIVRVQTLLSAMEALVLRAGELTMLAGDAVVSIERVRADAERVIEDVDVLHRRTGALISSIEPMARVAADVDLHLVRVSLSMLDRLMPLLTSVTQVDPELPGEAAELVHRSLPLLEEASTSLIPLLREAHAVMPDISQILSVVTRLEPVLTDVETRIAGLPGAGLLLKRGERAMEDADTEG